MKGGLHDLVCQRVEHEPAGEGVHESCFAAILQEFGLGPATSTATPMDDTQGHDERYCDIDGEGLL